MTSLPHQWTDVQGQPLSCHEKINVLNENLGQLRQSCQDVLDDAVLMGCSVQNAKASLLAMVQALSPQVKERG